MLPVFNSTDVKAMDAAAIASGVSGLGLMENAAMALFHALADALGGVEGKKIVIFAGSGNNGGDGFALGAILLSHAADAELRYVGDDRHITPDCAAMRARYTEADGLIFPVEEDCLAEADACVDAMFGIGFRGKLTGDAETAARLINEADCFKLAADLPSGIYSDYGGLCEGAVRVDCTVTFSYPKPSCLLMPSSTYCGRIIVADIGVPPVLAENHTPVFYMNDEGSLEKLPKRERSAHKTNFGHVLVVAGSLRYSGSAYLAAQTAVMSGAGLVTSAVPQCLYEIMASKLSECMVYRLPDEEYTGSASLYELLNLCAQAGAILIGPGLGREDDTGVLLRDLCSMVTYPVVLDADGINGLSGHIDVLSSMTQTPVLTPHDGEYARLFGANPPCEGRARVIAVANEAQRSHSVIVLKGHRTIVAAPDGRVCVNPTGNPGMAKGGSGDVLAGLVTSLLAQGLEPYDAACAAVWLHGAAGDRCAREIGEYGMTPTDVMRAIPPLLRCRNSIKYF